MKETRFFLRRSKSGNHIHLFAKKEDENVKLRDYKLKKDKKRPKDNKTSCENDQNINLQDHEIVKKNIIDNFTYEVGNTITDLVESGHKKQLFNFGGTDDFIFRNGILSILFEMIAKYNRFSKSVEENKEDTIEFQKLCFELLLPILLQSIIRDIISSSIHGVFHTLLQINH